jgi:hypothetical protein
MMWEQLDLYAVSDMFVTVDKQHFNCNNYNQVRRYWSDRHSGVLH